MIITCPNCSSKYSVHADAIGKGKMVRCAICGATWQQGSLYKQQKKEDIVDHLKITAFWFTVFICIFPFIFAKKTVIKFWPASSSFYELIDSKDTRSDLNFAIRNVSSFFIKKNGRLYMGVKGELANLTDEVQMVPNMTISLCSENQMVEDFKTSWVHEPAYKKLLPNQKIVFESDLKKVPYENLICNIKLNTI